MNIHEAIKTLDGVIPSSDNKMVDFEKVGFEHFFIAIAWEAVKTEIERLKKEVDYWEFETKVARKYICKVRKETAEKIFNKIKIKVLTEDMTEDRPQTLYRFTSFDIMKMAREIVEEFGVVFANGHATVEIKE